MLLPIELEPVFRIVRSLNVHNASAVVQILSLRRDQPRRVAANIPMSNQSRLPRSQNVVVVVVIGGVVPMV